MVVTDARELASLIRSHLEHAGFRVLWLRSGEAALDELRRHPVALMVVDFRLPGIDGLQLCRRAGGSVPTVMLTDGDEEPDRVAGVELSADDFVSKPFPPRELVARVRTVLRRAESGRANDVVTLGTITLSRSRREVRVGGREVVLTPKEFDLLAHLIERPGVVVSRGALLADVWGFLLPGETRTVEVHVGQVRKKLGDPSLIRTVRGVGYKAVAA
jgi:DNA-binding response OmpR family regulator